MSSPPGWTTVAAYDTPFLADLLVDHLEDEGIATRVLNDSAGGNLPHISFGTGGYRVQVHHDRVEEARAALAALPEDAVGDVDVGTFTDGEGVGPPAGSSPTRRAGGGHAGSGSAGRRGRGAILVALIAIVLTLLVGIGVTVFGPGA